MRYALNDTEILQVIGEQARDAFQAEHDYFVWRAHNEPAPFDTHMLKYLEYMNRSAPFTRSLRDIADGKHSEFVSGKLESVVQSIQRQMNGTE